MNALLFCAPRSEVRPSSSYLQQKLARFVDGGQSGQSTLPIIDPSSPLTNLKAGTALPEILVTKIEAGKACVLEQLRSRFVLADNESIVSDTFGYLSQAWQGIAANVVALKRETTFATFFIVLTDVCVDVLRDGDQEFFSIVDSGRPLYPVPPPRPIDLGGRERAADGAGSTLTELKATNSTHIRFGWRLPNDPCDKSDWWAVYRGVMPAWCDLGKWKNWDYICKKGETQPRNGSRTVEVTEMVSGAIYTFALFQWKWDLMDYQEFHAP